MRHRTNRVKAGFALAFVFAMVCMGLLVSSPPVRANHDTIAWSDPMRVAGATGFSDSAPCVVADSHGYTYVFYLTRTTATGVVNVNVTKIQAVGPSGLPVVKSTAQVNDVSNVATGFIVACTIDQAGNLYVAWTRTTATLGNEVYVSKSTDGGVTWDVGVRANAPNAAGDDSWPAITATPQGTVYVAWVQAWGGKYSLSVSQSTDGGLSFSHWQNLTTLSFVWSPAIASDASGRVYVAFGGPLTPSASTYDTNVTWSDDGVAWAPWQTITNSQDRGFFPALAVDQHGAVHLAWFSNYGSIDYSIHTSMSTDRGATWSTPISLQTGGASGFIGYLATEGDTLMYVWGPSQSPGYIISADDGSSWYPSASVASGVSSYTTVAADQNGTFWAANPSAGNIVVRWWLGPPSAPVVTSVAASGTDGLAVTWTPSPEKNVAVYQVWRSGDGSTYQIVATLPASASDFTDTGLANGTYWYKVTAVNTQGTTSHVSNAASGVVGVTVQQLLNQIAVLQGKINAANADLASLQTQLTSLQGQLTALKGTADANNKTLGQVQTELNNLQTQLNNLQGQQATQTISYANLAFEIIVVVLLVVVLLNQMRKPKNPQLMMAQPGQAAPKPAEDDL